MLRTIFAVGLMAILGLIALKFIFGIFGFLFAILLMLFVLAIKIALIGFVVYLAIRILSPDTARRIRQKWSGA
jgi:predicted lipid-binding transport protein (Tim44 family)